MGAPAENLLSRLDGVRSRGLAQWSAKCPAHDDRSPSLSIREADDGRVLLHCFGGCATTSVIESAGLELSDLFPKPLPDVHRGNRRRPRLNAWALIDAISFRLTCITLIATKIERGDALDPEDRATLHAAIIDVQTATTEATRVC